jgi:hypothetical protein
MPLATLDGIARWMRYGTLALVGVIVALAGTAGLVLVHIGEQEEPPRTPDECTVIESEGEELARINLGADYATVEEAEAAWQQLVEVCDL